MDPGFQFGKTTLSLSLLKDADESHSAYPNRDMREVRHMLLEGSLPVEQSLIIFDEIHKCKHWRNLIKGFYDNYKSRKRFLLTGSARLDHYSKTWWRHIY